MRRSAKHTPPYPPLVRAEAISAATTPLGFLSLLGEFEPLASVVFLSFVKGRQALAAHRYRLLGLVLGVDLSLLVILLPLANTSRALTRSAEAWHTRRSAEVAGGYESRRDGPAG